MSVQHPTRPSAQCQLLSAHRDLAAAENPAQEPRPLPELARGQPAGQSGTSSSEHLGRTGLQASTEAPRSRQQAAGTEGNRVQPGRGAAQGLTLSELVCLNRVQMRRRLGLADASAAPRPRTACGRVRPLSCSPPCQALLPAPWPLHVLYTGVPRPRLASDSFGEVLPRHWGVLPPGGG